MPIYGNSISGDAWYIYKNITAKEFIDFAKIIIEAQHNFVYKHDEILLKSIKINTKLNNFTLASYDISKTNMDIATYQTKIEELIKEANRILSKKHKYNNYKFDITGSWNIGKIIIMKKK